MILHCWRELFDDFRKQLLVDVSCGEIRFQPIIWILVFIVVRQAVLLLNLIIFVVTGVYYDGWMMSNSLELSCTFSFNGSKDFWESWIIAATCPSLDLMSWSELRLDFERDLYQT